MDENKKQSVEKWKNRINEKYGKLIELNTEAKDNIESLFSDYTKGLIEQDELNQKFDDILSKYKLNNTISTDAVARREEIKDAFVNRNVAAEEYLRRFNEIIEQYNNDEIKTMIDLEKRMIELNSDYKDKLIDLDAEYEVLMNNKDIDMKPEPSQKNSLSDSETPLSSEEENDEQIIARISKEDVEEFGEENTVAKKRIFVSDKNSVNMLYTKIKKELEEQQGKVTFLNNIISDTESLKQKYLKELREAETKCEILKEKLDSLDQDKKYSQNVTNEKTNFIQKNINRNVDAMDKELNKINRKLETDKKLIVYQWEKNTSLTDRKRIKLDEKMQKLVKKSAKIQNKQKKIVEKQLDRYYKEMKKELSAVRSQAKLEIEISKSNQLQNNLNELKENNVELNERKNEVIPILAPIYSSKIHLNEFKQQRVESRVESLQRKIQNASNLSVDETVENTQRTR